MFLPFWGPKIFFVLKFQCVQSFISIFIDKTPKKNWTKKKLIGRNDLSFLFFGRNDPVFLDEMTCPKWFLDEMTCTLLDIPDYTNSL